MNVNRLKTKTKINGFKDDTVDRVELIRTKNGIVTRVFVDDEYGWAPEFSHDELKMIFDEFELLNLVVKPDRTENIPDGWCRDRRGGIRQLGAYDG